MEKEAEERVKGSWGDEGREGGGGISQERQRAPDVAAWPLFSPHFHTLSHMDAGGRAAYPKVWCFRLVLH